MDEATIIKAVRDYARNNYDRNGWDYVVECYEDKDILKDIEGATTVEEAILTIGQTLKILDDYRKDIQETAF